MGIKLEEILRFFPYKPRKYQVNALRFIQTSLKDGYKGIILNASTGFGKTPIVLAALIPYMLEGYKVVWAVRTGNETDRPIEELKEFKKRLGIRIFGLSFRGKRDMCLLARDIFKGSIGYEDANFVCKNLRKRCKYYNEFLKGINPLIFTKEPRLYSEILEISRELQVCPYMVQHYLLKFASLVSLSYNYIVRREISWSIRKSFRFKDTILVMDEAHNLQNINLFSDKITYNTLLRSIREAEDHDWSIISDILNEFKEKIDKMRKGLSLRKEEDIVFDPGEFSEILDYSILEKMQSAGSYIRKEQLKEGKRPHSSLYHFSSFWLKALDNMDEDGFAFIAGIDNRNFYMEIWDMRSSEVLKNIWNEFKSTIFISGTIKPISAFSDTIGIDNYVGKEIPSHYKPENVLGIVLSDLTTRGEELSNEVGYKYIRSIELFIGSLNTNIAIFTASYRIQKKLIDLGLLNSIKKTGRLPFIEERGMSGEYARRMLEKFKGLKDEDKKGVLIGPAGGRFAEGADFPGKELEGIFIVGIPFDRVTARTRKYLEYYTKIYGKRKGRYYGYIIPALRRASQAMGRALRSENDRAVIVAGDYRFKNYLELLPDFFLFNLRIIKSLEIPLIVERFNR